MISTNLFSAAGWSVLSGCLKVNKTKTINNQANNNNELKSCKQTKMTFVTSKKNEITIPWQGVCKLCECPGGWHVSKRPKFCTGCQEAPQPRTTATTEQQRTELRILIASTEALVLNFSWASMRLHFPFDPTTFQR